MTPMYKLVILN